MGLTWAGSAQPDEVGDTLPSTLADRMVSNHRGVSVHGVTTELTLSWGREDEAEDEDIAPGHGVSGPDRLLLVSCLPGWETSCRGCRRCTRGTNSTAGVLVQGDWLVTWFLVRSWSTALIPTSKWPGSIAASLSSSVDAGRALSCAGCGSCGCRSCGCGCGCLSPRAACRPAHVRAGGPSWLPRRQPEQSSYEAWWSVRTHWGAAAKARDQHVLPWALLALQVNLRYLTWPQACVVRRLHMFFSCSSLGLVSCVYIGGSHCQVWYLVQR